MLISKMMKPVALILVDIQYDFLEGGSLAVPNATNILPAVHKLIDNANLIIATQDWHPQNHISFAVNHPGKQPFDEVMIQHDGRETKQVLWPAHCVQNTHGAEILTSISKESINHIVQKGMNPKVDSYSGFADNDYQEITPLAKILYQNNVETVIVVGLAADYCVKMTCLDAIKFGFKTVLVREGTLGVAPDQFNATMNYLQSKGVEVTDVDYAIKTVLQKQ
ncbi:Nicotinamidase [Phascolomyces articulosus]|uniref:nicotinamidase n=1 Tax=Phascolomyces articulosus TaxID=60185 RepID=A0AAD5KED5_9FUNG|nr:Nicotinamidase [Phascolomyces articulosus]